MVKSDPKKPIFVLGSMLPGHLSMHRHRQRGGKEGQVLHRSKRGWVWNQFFVIEEYTGPDPVLVGRVSIKQTVLQTAKYKLTESINKIWLFSHLTLSAPLRRRHGKWQYQVYSFRRGCRNHLCYRWQDRKHPCNEDAGPRRAGTVHFNSPGGGQTHQQAFRTSFRVHCESSGH